MGNQEKRALTETTWRLRQRRARCTLHPHVVARKIRFTTAAYARGRWWSSMMLLLMYMLLLLLLNLLLLLSL